MDASTGKCIWAFLGFFVETKPSDCIVFITFSFDQQNKNFTHKQIFFSLFADSAMHRDCPLDCKVYVGNLGSNGNKTDLERAFGYYGPLRSVWVARNPPGFAFVEFEDSRDATDAVRELDGRQGSTSMDSRLWRKVFVHQRFTFASCVSRTGRCVDAVWE